MVFDNDFKEVTILLGTYTPIHFLSDFFSCLHSLVQLKTGYFFFEKVLFAVKFESID